MAPRLCFKALFRMETSRLFPSWNRRAADRAGSPSLIPELLLHFLIAESETSEQRDARRKRAGRSSGETFAETLSQMVGDVRVTRVAPADAEANVLSAVDIELFDAVFVTGSPMHVYDDTPEVRRQVAFMRAVFASGVPAFGSCAGLQLAVAAAGGSVQPMDPRIEAGIARRITATPEGLVHPLLEGRPSAWDALAIHTDEVRALPEGSTLLATNGATRVQAAEIRYDRGVFWGVQYHPELAPGEIAVALRAQASGLVEQGLARSEAAVDRQARLLDRLQEDPSSRSARWELGVDDECASELCRRRELSNFLANIKHLRNTSVRAKVS